MIPNVLSIAGSDPSGGAGIQADLKTFSALGCYGMAAITALTAQNTRGVRGVHVPDAEFVALELQAIFEDVRVDAVKIGMLANPSIVEAVAGVLSQHHAQNIVLDPVLVATSGDSLGSDDVVQAMVEHLFPLAAVITPNIPEAPEDMLPLAVRLRELGAAAVLVKGGHLDGEDAVDLLLDSSATHWLTARRVDTPNTHGTGCTLSSAIAAGLARGHRLEDAVDEAKRYLTGALVAGTALTVGTGHGPVHHFHNRW
jgi:hydroxymethylpyrimidine/phosphomethylpyrimidine kinase